MREPIPHVSLATRGDVRRSVVRAAVDILYGVRQLVFDQVDALAQHLVEDGTRHRAEAVPRHDLLAISKASQCRVDGVLAHAGFMRAQTWEHVFAVSGDGKSTKLGTGKIFVLGMTSRGI